MNKRNEIWSNTVSTKIITFFLVLTIAVAFTGCGKPTVFTDLNAITEHLAKVKGGTLDKPITLIVNIPLGDVTNAGSGWQRLLMIIENAGKNVALDLSDCEMTNTEFNPVHQVNSGKFFIISLVLPTAAKSIVGYRDNPSFTHFYNLRNISGSEVTSIGRNAFKECTSLRKADFPLATSIGIESFNDCSSLKGIDIPLVTSIGESAFTNC